MSNFLCNRKGITLQEVLISITLLSIGILGLLTLMPSTWRLAGRSDCLGRASGILLSQLQSYEAMLLNPSFTPTLEDMQQSKNIYPSNPGQAGASRKQGDVPFTVNTTLTDLGGGNAWLVRVNVSWPENPTGISETMRVTRQENNRQ
jgi:Tfp pilus assembly protein PilV